MTVLSQPRVLIGARVSPDFKRQVRVEAAKRDMTVNDAIKESLELWLSTPVCPGCDGAAFRKDGVWYCETCNHAVALEQVPQ